MDILDKVGKILAQADDADRAGRHDEASAFRSKADGLMFKYKIDEAVARAARAGSQALTLGKIVRIPARFVPTFDDFYDIHVSMISIMQTLTGAKCVFEGNDGTMSIFGTEADCRYLQLLWTSAHLTFSSKLFPTWSKSLSEGANIKAFAEAGYSWKAIWETGRVHGALSGVPVPPTDNGRMKRMCKRACAEQGVEYTSITQRREAYRDSYATNFRDVVRQRIARMVWDRSMYEVHETAALVLKSDADAISNLIIETYGVAPQGIGDIDRNRKQDDSGSARGRAAGQSVDLTNAGSGVGGRSEREALPS